MKLVNEIELNKDSISSLNKDEILFIMSCNECIDFLDIHKNYSKHCNHHPYPLTRKLHI